MKNILKKPWIGSMIGVLLLAFTAVFSVSTVFAWSTSSQYVDLGAETWSPDEGYHRGQVEYHGGIRYIRAGDNYVRWAGYEPRGWGYPALFWVLISKTTLKIEGKTAFTLLEGSIELGFMSS